jgi:pyruvyl transferase EpsI
MNETYALYRKCKHLSLACRERITFEWVQKNFVGIDAILCPDIVMSLTYTQHFERKGILICVRNDKESSWAMELLPEIKKACLKLDLDIAYSDTVESKSISVDEYEKTIRQKLDDFSTKRLVITDRLHGVIFAAITGTPCIAIDNFNHKVEGICKWMDKAPNVFYVKSFQEMEKTLEEMKFVYDNSWLNELQQDFVPLKERIGGLCNK